jgi:hypothetical protein
MWVCPSCGNPNREEGRYCDNCAQPRPEARTIGSSIQAPSLQSPLARIIAAIENRSRTDRKISNLWVVLAVFGFFATGAVYAFVIVIYVLHISLDNSAGDLYNWVFLYGRGLAMALFGAFFAVLAFRLIVRLNLHNEREERLRSAVMAFLRGQPRPPGKEPEIMDQLIALSAFDGQALVYEKKLDAHKWAYGIGFVLIGGGLASFLQYWIIFQDVSNHISIWPFEFVLSLLASFMSLAGLIVLLFVANHLMKTTYTHGVRWLGFTNSTAVALRKLGFAFDPPREEEPALERSLVRYAILTIVTLGLFGFYWLHTLISDPSKHFEDQWRFEDSLIEALDR